MPAQAGERERREHPSARREQGAAEKRGGHERGGAGDGGGKAHAQDGRAPEREGRPVALQIEHADASVRPRDAVRKRTDGVFEVRRGSVERERRLDQRQVVDPEPFRNAGERREAKGRPGEDREKRQRREGRATKRNPAELLGGAAGTRPGDKSRRRRHAGRGRPGGDPDAEQKTGRRPGGLGVRKERRPDPPRQRDRRDEAGRESDEEGLAGSRAPRGLRRHFWKKRKRLTEEGPSEKKSPERRGRAQSSSEIPARSSGAGIGSPFRYVPQVERMSTSR